METFPLFQENGTRLPAFEIENIFISLTMINRLLVKVDGVMDVNPRKPFARSSDIHVEFNFLGLPFVVWEPYGDNSRYWIGPADKAECVVDITKLEEVFKGYHPPLHRVIFGNLITFRFITRLFKHG